MSRLLILLCMVGWALYTVHTNSNKSGDFVAQESRAFSAQSPDTQAATSTEPQLQSIASAAAQSPHARFRTCLSVRPTREASCFGVSRHSESAGWFVKSGGFLKKG